MFIKIPTILIADILKGTTLPAEAKSAVTAILKTLDNFEQRKKGRDLMKIVFLYLDTGYPEHRESWLGLFGADHSEAAKPAKYKFHDNMQGARKHRKDRMPVSTLDGNCDGCTQEERERMLRQQQVQKKAQEAISLSESKLPNAPETLDKAKSAKEVLAFFDNPGSGVSPLANMRSTARSFGLKIDKDETNIEKIADMLWDAIKGERT